jgi:DNA-binding protein H-NS
MKTYREYQAQIAELQKLAAAAREREVAAAREKIATLMRAHGLTAADLTGTKSTKSTKSTQSTKSTKSGEPRTSVSPKYRDDASGQTWTGRGRAPKWLSGRDRNAYLIK